MTTWELKQKLRGRLGNQYSEMVEARVVPRVYRLFFHDELYIPIEVDEYLYLGLYYREQGKMDLFLYATEQALARGSDRAHIRLYYYYWSIQQPAKGMIFLLTGLDKKSADVAYYCYNALLEGLFGEVEKSILPFSDDPEYYHRLAIEWGEINHLYLAGVRAMATEDYSTMLKLFQQILETEAQEQNFHYLVNHYLGNYYYNVIANKEKAKFYWTKNLFYPPHDLPAKYNLALFNLVDSPTKIAYFREVTKSTQTDLVDGAWNGLIKEYIDQKYYRSLYQLLTQELGYRSEQPRIEGKFTQDRCWILLTYCGRYLSDYEKSRLYLLYRLPVDNKEFFAPDFLSDPEFLHFLLRINHVPLHLQEVREKYLDDLFTYFRNEPTYLSRFYLPLDIFVLIKDTFALV